MKLLDYYLKIILRKFVTNNLTSYENFFPRKKFNLLLKNIFLSLEYFKIFLEKTHSKMIFLEQEKKLSSFFKRRVKYEELLTFLNQEFPNIIWDNIKKFIKEYNNLNLDEKKKLFSLLNIFFHNNKVNFVREYSSKEGTIIELGHRKDTVRILFLKPNNFFSDKLLFLAWFKTKNHKEYEVYLNRLLEGKIDIAA